MSHLSIRDLDLKGKRVFIRVDFNVPLQKNENGDMEITSDKRIKASLPTIRYALEQGAGVILASHLGRPKGKVNADMSLKPCAVRLAELLGTVPYSSSMTVALAFPDSAFPKPLEGFGFLVPKRERRRLVACTWVGTKFPHRAPAGTTMLRCFLGGMDDAAILGESDDAVTAAVLGELHEIVGFRAEPLFRRIFRWPRSMAQYTVGHPRRLAEIEARAAAIPGLHLAGNAYQGIGIPDCIRMGKQAAETIAKAPCGA